MNQFDPSSPDIEELDAPCWDDWVPNTFYNASNGLWTNNKSDENVKSQRVTMTRVCVNGIIRDEDSECWSLYLWWETPDGSLKSKVIPISLLAELPKETRNQLSEQGLVILRGDDFRRFLIESFEMSNQPQWLATHRVGFSHAIAVDGSPSLCFVYPQQTLYCEDVDIEQGVGLLPSNMASSHLGFHASGTLEDWRALMEETRGHHLQTFCLCTAFAGIFLSLSGTESGGFHLYGVSSRGKTLCLQLACSVHGNAAAPNQDAGAPSLLNSWSTTNNALELIANTYSDTILAIDELGVRENGVTPVYALLNGQGKARMTRSAQMQELKRWNIMVLSSGEIPMHTQSPDRRRPVMQGELIRMIDIPIEDLSPPDSADVAERLKSGCATVYGTAGPAFVQKVLNTFKGTDTENSETELRRNLTEHVEEVRDELRDFLALQGVDLHAHHWRALKRFALVAVAGLWAENDVLPHTEEEIMEAVRAVLIAWVNSQIFDSEEERAMEAVREYYLQHVEDMVNLNVDQPNAAMTSSDYGIVRDKDLILNENQFAMACQGLVPKLVAHALNSKGMLQRNDGQNKRKVTISQLGLNNVRRYVIKLDKLIGDAPGVPGASQDMPRPRRRATPVPIARDPESPDQEAPLDSDDPYNLEGLSKI
ncbi:DUF927 domain-containing protein [Thiorhodococcus fuscus]|uniref:DUF927 domain-containing protein n=1 Tax=Thiorhodococcus fuscus TaxID=527200 RepID=A0ABW4Y7G6_9GAMM